MYVRLTGDEGPQNFSIWVYGEERLARGSGLFIPETGISTNHHFLLPEEETTFSFVPGFYDLEVFARIVGERRHRRLLSQRLHVNAFESASIGGGAGLYFDWSPDYSAYHSHVEIPINKESIADVLALERLRPYG